MIATLCNKIFDESIIEYHKTDNVDTPFVNPYPSTSLLEHLLYHKNWIDTVQWHLEDIVRNPAIDPVEGLGLKRRIDSSNQERTDMVEYIDSYLLEQYKNAPLDPDSTVNTESPAWAIDRLSILALKIYHMQAEVNRTDASPEHIKSCTDKLQVLLEQRKDLGRSIEELLADIAIGKKRMKVYKQMKMYNDPALNPVLYKL